MKTERSTEQLGSFLMTPLRFVWHLVLWAIFLLLSPILFVVAVVFGLPYMNGDEIGLTKTLEVVIGPFAFTLWWILVTHFSGHYRARRLIERREQSGCDYSERELRFLEGVDKSHHLRTFGVLLLSFAGSFYSACLFHAAEDHEFLIVVLVGICLPAILKGFLAFVFRFRNGGARTGADHKL